MFPARTTALLVALTPSLLVSCGKSHDTAGSPPTPPAGADAPDASTLPIDAASACMFSDGSAVVATIASVPALAAVHSAEQGLAGASQDPARSLDVAIPDRGVCAIRGGAGVFLAPLAFHTQGDCQSLCETFQTTNPARTCTWRGSVLLGDPRRACIVLGGDDQALSTLAAATESGCRAECDRFPSDDGRTCDWGTERIRHPARGTECRILSGAGANLLTPLHFGTKATCQALCDQATDPYRRCSHGNETLRQPDAGMRCEIWDRSGAVLTPVFYGSQADCATRCASFSLDPAPFCFYGATRL
jgi:hypothetical protein